MTCFRPRKCLLGVRTMGVVIWGNITPHSILHSSGGERLLHRLRYCSVVRPMEKNRKIENSTLCKIVTHEDFNLKLGTRDYVADITHHATLGSNRPSGGFPPNRGNITPMWPFFLGHAPRSNRRTDSYAEWLKWRVSAQGSAFWGSGWCVTSYGENIPKKLPKKGPV